MDNNIKLIMTEEAADFDNETLEMFQNFNISAAFCTKDGEELLNRILREEPDVVLMESFMTRLDAIGVMRAVKRQNGKQPLFIVFSSFPLMSLLYHFDRKSQHLFIKKELKNYYRNIM